MTGSQRDGERFDPIGLEVPFAERFDEADNSYDRAAMHLDEETFVVSPAEHEGELSWLESAVQSAEAQAAESSQAEWLETEWLESGGSDAESVESFADRIGREWSNRRKGDPAFEPMKDWLLKDHEETVTGARIRWRGRKVKPDFWDRIDRAWMIAREENMRFQTERSPGVAALGPFAPPAASVDLVGDPLIQGSDKAPVAPLTIRFARRLRARFGYVDMSNYRGHGGGAFLNRGYSLDIFLKGRDERGFFKKDEAIKLLRAINGAAADVRANWRAIYNDFSVADAINREFRRTHVIFVGAASKNRKKDVTGINWHGPDPLILHVHLDLAPHVNAPLGEIDSEHEETPQQCPHCGGHTQEAQSEWISPHAEATDTHEASESSEAAWEAEDEQERGRYDEPERERIDSFDAFEQEDTLAAAGLSPAERKALEITSTLETGKRGGFFGLSGNFDGQGLSFGLVNWTIGTGSLQPLLRDFAREQSDRWTAIFGSDAQRFHDLIMPEDSAAKKAQHRFAIEEMNEQVVIKGRKRWRIKQPWHDYFLKLSEDSAFRRIQIRYVGRLFKRAAYYCRLFKLKSERSFAFMFDAVSSHGQWWLVKKFGKVEKRNLMIEERLRRLQERYGPDSVPEDEILLVIADVLGETSAPRWAAMVRARKRWFVTGELARARELAGLEPSPIVPWAMPGNASHEANEELAWLDFGDRHDERTHETEDGSFRASEDRLSDDREWQPATPSGEGFPEFLESDHAFLENPAPTSTSCNDYSAEYAKLIRRKGTKAAEVEDRTVGDKTSNLILQFRDYDVNAYLPGTKSAHSAALAQVTEFIQSRVAAGADVEVTITGSASKTGTVNFNQTLSEKRAHCMGEMLRTSLHPATARRVRFNENGTGFSEAKCHGADCELPGYRSVLVSVHALGKPPAPQPPELPGWTKYEIRCCAFQTTTLAEVAIDELSSKLPAWMPSGVAQMLSRQLLKRLEGLLRKVPKLASLLGDLGKLLKFLPIEITHVIASFQIRERGKAEPKQMTFRYDGWGARLAVPFPGSIDDALDELLRKVPGLENNAVVRNTIKKLLKNALESVVPPGALKLLAKLDSTTPGPWTSFELNRPAVLRTFAVGAEIFIDVISDIMQPGQIRLAFEGPWRQPNVTRRLAITCEGCCTSSIIPLRVGGEKGFDVLMVSAGSLKEGSDARGADTGETELFAFSYDGHPIS